MAMENPPFEDVFAVEHGGFPIAILVFGGCKIIGDGLT